MTGKEYNEQFSEEELANEIWKDIPNYEGYYQVSNLGRVKSFNRVIKCGYGRTRIIIGKMMMPVFDKNKRCHVILSRKRSIKLLRVHRLVLLAFIGRSYKGTECCHNDGNPSNNRLSNLRWDTHKNNIADKIKHGTENVGERNGNNKYTLEQILEIRRLYKIEKFKQTEIARKFNMTFQQVHVIVREKNWKWLNRNDERRE